MLYKRAGMFGGRSIFKFSTDQSKEKVEIRISYDEKVDIF
jgi:hypothetical protein